MVERFRARAAAVRSRGLPPIEGPERKRFAEQAQLDFMDYAMLGDAEVALEDGILTLRVDLRPRPTRRRGGSADAVSRRSSSGCPPCAGRRVESGPWARRHADSPQSTTSPTNQLWLPSARTWRTSQSNHDTAHVEDGGTRRRHVHRLSLHRPDAGVVVDDRLGDGLGEAAHDGALRPGQQAQGEHAVPPRAARGSPRRTRPRCRPASGSWPPG